MRSRLLVGVLTMLGTVSAFATQGHEVGPTQQWAVVNFTRTTQVAGAMLLGSYLIVHDDTQMPCTRIYRFVPGNGPQREVVAFECVKLRREKVEKTTLTTMLHPDDYDMRRLLEYQIAGDAEAHGVPSGR